MANYMSDSPYYSLLGDKQFQTAFSNPQKQMQVSQDSTDPWINKNTASAAAQGAQSGGLSGMLMSGGVNSLLTSGAAAGGPYAIAGGLLLSELQAAQEAKARQEAEMIANEKQRNSNMQGQLNQNARSTFRV